MLACELARRGTSVRLIDMLTAPTDETRAIVVHARSLEMMERIGTVDALIASGVRTTADPERRVAERCGGGRDGALVIVRPDGYIGLRAGLGDDEAVREHFARISTVR